MCFLRKNKDVSRKDVALSRILFGWLVIP